MLVDRPVHGLAADLVMTDNLKAAEAAVEYGLVDEILQPSQAKELTLVGGAASHE